MRAVADATRRRILSLLRARAASTTELAEALEQPKGTVAHHVKVLEDAGLVRVVSTRKVRALTEKYYGRLARLYRIVADDGDATDGEGFAALMLRHAADEVAPDAGTAGDPTALTVVHARVRRDEVDAFVRRLQEVASDFLAADEEEGDRVFGLVAGIYGTDLKELPRKPRKGRKRA